MHVARTNLALTWVLSAILLILGLTLTLGVSALGESNRVAVGFGDRISDSDLIALLERHAVEPAAVFTWTSGLTGTHRSYEAQSPAEFVAAARAKSIESFEGGLAGNTARLQRFLDTYSASQVTSDAAVASEGRALLDIRYRLSTALAGARAGEPLAFGAEVTSRDSRRLDALTRDGLVRKIESSGSSEHGLFPVHLVRPPVDARIETATGAEIHALIRSTLQSAATGVDR